MSSLIAEKASGNDVVGLIAPALRDRNKVLSGALESAGHCERDVVSLRKSRGISTPHWGLTVKAAAALTRMSALTDKTN